VATQGQFHGIVVTGTRHSTLTNIVSTNNSLSSVGAYDDLHFDYNVFLAGAYGENHANVVTGAELGANGQMNSNPGDPSFATSRYGLYVADGQTGSIGDVTVTAGGTGYVFNDSLTIAGGTCSARPKLTVNAAPGGVISSVVHDFSVGGGVCTVLPSNPAGVTGGTGTGATFTIAWSSAYMTGIHIGQTVTGGVRVPSFITGSGWTIQTSAGNFGP
jgi:hypothetical protein